MKIRVYQPRLEGDEGKLSVHAHLKDARAVASAVASSRGVPVQVWRYLIEGPDTEVVVALLNVFSGGDTGDAKEHEPYWTPSLHEVHKPTIQIPLPGDGPILWAVEIIPSEEPVESEGGDDE